MTTDRRTPRKTASTQDGEDYLMAGGDDLIAFARDIKKWERENIQYASSQLGVELFINLAHAAVINRNRIGMLKHVYLSLPYSEKGLRLHMRRLEEEGWIATEKSERDLRLSIYYLTSKSWSLISKYSTFLREGFVCRTRSL